MGDAPIRGPLLTQACWKLVEILSRMLDADERLAVGGDLEESGETGLQAVRDVLGLVVRRQAALWKNWRPWLALVGLIGPVSILLSLGCVWLRGAYDLNLWVIRNRRDIAPTILSQIGLSVRHGVVLLALSSLLLFCWSWAAGFVLGAMSRRTIWFNGILFCLALLFLGSQFNRPYQDGAYQYSVDGWPLPLVFYTAILPLILQTTLILLPSLWGMHQGLQPPSRLLQAILWVVAVVIALSVGSWFWRWPFNVNWQMRVLLLAVYWPIGYLAVTEIGRRWRHRIGSI
jgi:hypothetical protein